FFDDPAAPESYTLSLHDALPIYLTSKEAKMGKVMRHTLGASLNIRHNLSSSKGPKPLQLKLLTTYIPKTSAFTLAFSTSQRLRTTRASARTFFLPRCKMRLKKRLLAFSRRLHARIRKTRYMHKMRCLLINRRSLLLALRLLWKTPIFPSNSRFPRLCAKCLLKLKR